ncbi:amino acid ABC transporter permease [Peterkaempfera bronchialis]|uniref:Amino acid ABC transporter permease n=1 Tax=Peterkaempfera bronchialis TaxID=2126346 RepID=A0A345SRK5_9ACTN|nr:amino acid ABC transporter permease [Peterkaempfera bronchialis]AXI76360.1 amino acid ABC transporter permease [Peterkaempfera bronchialis]
MRPHQAAAPAADGATRPEDLSLQVSRRPRPGRWLAVLAAAFFAVWLGYTIVVNPNLHWDVIARYQFDRVVLEGLWVTVQLTLISQAVGIGIGVVAAVMQLSESPVLRLMAGAYTWFFRGTPLLVQLIFWFNLALLFPEISIGVPFDGPKLISWQSNQVITGFVAALLGLSINEGAYMAEIVRAGIQSVDPGQREAGASIGMSNRQILTRVVLPQAMRVIIPPFGNQFISMLKTTSLVSVIAGADLMTVSQHLYLANFEVIALLVVASLWYLVLTTIASLAQHAVERRFSPGAAPPLRRRVLANLLPGRLTKGTAQ